MLKWLTVSQSSVGMSIGSGGGSPCFDHWSWPRRGFLCYITRWCLKTVSGRRQSCGDSDVCFFRCFSFSVCFFHTSHGDVPRRLVRVAIKVVVSWLALVPDANPSRWHHARHLSIACVCFVDATRVSVLSLKQKQKQNKQKLMLQRRCTVYKQRWTYIRKHVIRRGRSNIEWMPTYQLTPHGWHTRMEMQSPTRDKEDCWTIEEIEWTGTLMFNDGLCYQKHTWMQQHALASG